MVTACDDMPGSVINQITLTVIIINNCYVYDLAISRQITRERVKSAAADSHSPPRAVTGEALEQLLTQRSWPLCITWRSSPLALEMLFWRAQGIVRTFHHATLRRIG